MSIRLSLALEEGFAPIPDGTICVMCPRAETDLSELPKERVLIVQPFRPDHDHFVAQGFACADALPDDLRFSGGILFVTRSRALNRDLVGRLADVTDGPVLIDGDKTDGIESLLKSLRQCADVSPALSKAHGKIAWFQPDNVDFSDWKSPQFQTVDGFATSAGIFSPDAPDPASVLLATALPEKLGRRIADLGAGWGYLSAKLLTSPDVKEVHLVEADQRALACARRNTDDPRAVYHWADATSWKSPEQMDAVVMNPPFHTTRAAQPALGQAFIETAARILSPRGQLVMVANRHLPYETVLTERFARVDEISGDNRFKVLHAQRPRRKSR